MGREEEILKIIQMIELRIKIVQVVMRIYWRIVCRFVREDLLVWVVIYTI